MKLDSFTWTRCWCVVLNNTVDQTIPSVNPFHLMFVTRTSQTGRSQHVRKWPWRAQMYSICPDVCVEREETLKFFLKVTGRRTHYWMFPAQTPCSTVARLRHLFLPEVVFAVRWPQSYEPITIIVTVSQQIFDTNLTSQSECKAAAHCWFFITG